VEGEEKGGEERGGEEGEKGQATFDPEKKREPSVGRAARHVIISECSR